MAKKKSSIGFDPLAWMKNSSGEPRVEGQESRVGSRHSPLATRDSPAVIALGDSFTIADVAARYAEWKKTLAAGGQIEMDAGSLKTVDTAALQLLAALAREAQTRGLPLRWRASSEALRQGATRLGLTAAMRLS